MLDRTTLRRLILAVPLSLLTLTAGYWLGMRYLEADPRSFAQSLQWATETMTTTGYGVDGRWHHPAMVLFVVIAQFSGVAIVFLVLPVVLIPMLESRFQTRVPRSTTRGNLTLIYRPGLQLGSFLEELLHRKLRPVVVESNDASCRQWINDGLEALFSHDPDELFDNVRLQQVEHLVLAGPDDENALLLVEARQQGWQGKVVVVASEAMHSKALLHAGASVVLTPKVLLGRALAGRVCPRVAEERVEHQVTLPDSDSSTRVELTLDFAEIRVEQGSAAADRTLEDLQLGSRTGCSIVGQWHGHRLETPAQADTIVRPGGVLTALGNPDSIVKLQQLCSTENQRDSETQRPIYVLGYGTVGTCVAATLRARDENVTTFDLDPRSGADHTLDALDVEAIISLGPRARAAVIALESDAQSLLATLRLRQCWPDCLLVVGLRDGNGAARLRQAGADAVATLSDVCADLLLEHLLHERRLWPTEKMQVLVVQANLPETTVEALDLRNRSGATILGVFSSQGRLIQDVDAKTIVTPGSQVLLGGDREALDRAQELLS